MPSDEAPLTALASSLADGGDVDWFAAESTSTTPEEQVCVQQLKIIAKLAGAYREAADAAFAPPPPAPPRERWGPLTLRRMLGEGAFGSVYLAWDPSLEREVALKLLRDSAKAASVIEEGRLLARVRHPNVVMVHGVDEFDGAVGLWMELIDGVTIKDILEARGTMGSREAALTGMDLCRALAAVHKAGLLHRDIKAQNVMREAGGRIVLMDFGGGERTAERAGGSRTRVATPLYLAPEVLKGGSATIASDIYSVGVLLYHAVTNGFPIEGRTLDEVEAAHADRPAPLLDRRPDLPGRFARVVERAIHPDPVRRYRSAGELQKDLLDALEDDIAEETILTQTPRVASRKPSVAVLPFLNDGGGEADYLGASLAEDLINGLSKVDGLRVAARMASFAPQHVQNLDPTAVCRDLKVDAVLCGTVRRRGDQLRINAELVSGANGSHIWSEGYTRQVDDLPAEWAAQEEIARSVVDRMKVKLGDLAKQPLIRRNTDNVRALACYRQGRYNWGKRYQGGLVAAIQEFGKAIAEDAGFALPYAGLADAFAFLGFYSLDTPREAFKKARAAAQQALAIEPNLPEAHTSLGLVKLGDEWDFDGAKAEFLTALAMDLDGSQVLTRIYLSWLLVLMGDTSEAAVQARGAQRTAPEAPLVSAGAGHTFYLLGRDEEAVEYYEQALAFDPECIVAIYLKGACRARQKDRPGHMEEAIALLERAADISGRTGNVWRAPFFLAILGNFYARVGAADKVSAIFAELDAIKARGRYVPPHSQAFIYAGMNDLDRAFEWQAKAYADGAPPFNYFSPVIANMHGDPRHDAEKKRMGLRV